MANRRHSAPPPAHLATNATIAVIVLTSFVLGGLALQGSHAGAIAARIVAGLVAAALLFHVGVCMLQGWRSLRSGVAMAAVLWWVGAVVQALFALLSLTYAFPIR